MKVQNLQVFSNKKTNFFNDSFNWVKNISNIAGDFSKNFTKGVFEVYTGIELAAPLTKIGTYGRICGRNTAKLYADVSFVLGLVMTTGGTFASGATPILAIVGGPIGIVTATASPALIAGGALAIVHGIVLNRNYDKLSKLEISKNTSEKNKIEFKKSKPHISGKNN